jgi:DNA-binding IclR family transcriptional regulator
MTEDYTLREKVLRKFLENPKLGPSEMAELLDANYNSVKSIYGKLRVEGFLKRAGRGNYEPDVHGIILNLMDRIEALEKGEK